MRRISFFLGLLTLAANTSFADVHSDWFQEVYDFHLSCTFANSVSCTATADLFGPLVGGAPALSTEVLKNILLIACNGTTVYSDGAIVRPAQIPNTVTYIVYSSDGNYRINLTDAPFSGTPSPKTVDATLQFPGTTVPGSCTITTTPVITNP